MSEFSYAFGVVVMLSSPVLGMHMMQNPVRDMQNSTTWNAFWNNPRCQKLKPTKCGEQLDHFVLVSAYCPQLNLAYLKNPKANSKGIKQYMIKECPGKVIPEGDFDYMQVDMSDDVPYVFTFVREPFARAVSAYGEVDAKTSQKLCRAALVTRNCSTFLEIPRGQEPQRFEAFLDDFKHSRIPDECEPKHADLQIERICEVPKQALRAIGLLEQFEDQISIIRESAKNASNQRPARLTATSVGKYSEWEDYPPYVHIKEKDKRDVSRSATSKTRQLVYDMYEADYVCLNYPFLV